MSVNYYQTTQSCSQEDSDLHGLQTAHHMLNLQDFVYIYFLSYVNMIVMMDIWSGGVLMTVCDAQFHFTKDPD
jgi:hypothetical protein